MPVTKRGHGLPINRARLKSLQRGDESHARTELVLRELGQRTLAREGAGERQLHTENPLPPGDLPSRTSRNYAGNEGYVVGDCGETVKNSRNFAARTLQLHSQGRSLKCSRHIRG